MKLKNLNIKDHPILGDLDLDFTDKSGEILNTIVFAGSNGSGKTSILEAIYNNVVNSSSVEKIRKIEENIIIPKISHKINKFTRQSNLFNLKALLSNIQYYTENEGKELLKEIQTMNYLPKLIYIPTEINFNQLKMTSNTLEIPYSFGTKIDNNFIGNIPSYIATRINYTANTEEDLTMKEVRAKVAKDINEIFEILDLDVKLIGLTKDNKSLPLFENSNGETFDINKLSSGEKQLFLRALTLKMLKAKDSIILIDEPEISLHPKWQQRILKVYEDIGENNQIFVATHSPHIVSSTYSKNLRLLSRTKEGIKVTSGEELNEIYGKNVERALQDIMELDSLRTPEVELQLRELRKLVDEEKFNTDEFKMKYKSLESLLGTLDQDLMLIRLDIKRKQV